MLPTSGTAARASQRLLAPESVFHAALLAVFLLAIAPSDGVFSRIFSARDTLNHAAAFLALSFLGDRAHPAAGIPAKAAGLAAYGLLIEVVQSFLPHRNFSAADLLVDVAAIGAYFLVGRRLVRFAAGACPRKAGACETD